MEWTKTGASARAPRRSRLGTLRAVDLQHAYTILDLASPRPTLYVASAAGASVARVLERISALDPNVRVVDAHPLDVHDPSGIDIFYLMLVATIVGFITIFQIGANVNEMSLRHWTEFIVGLALVASLVFVLVDGPLLHRLDLPVLETWAILSLQVVAVAAVARPVKVLLGRWSVLPTWLFFV